MYSFVFTVEDMPQFAEKAFKSTKFFHFKMQADLLN